MAQEQKQKSIADYLSEIQSLYSTGQAREHTYRPMLERLFSSLAGEVRPLNEPAHSKFGAPDFVFLRGKLPIGYAEAKDLDTDLNRIEKGKQMERYFGYPSIILTNCLEFRFYKYGKAYREPIKIAELVGRSITPIAPQFSVLQDELSAFFSSPPNQIESGGHLAKIMGGNARRIRDNTLRFLSQAGEKSGELLRIYETIKKLLVHDLTPETFADMYAQTLVYGLFVARFHDKTPEDFSRSEARDLIPASNPLLQEFFNHIAGPKFDPRLGYIVDELCEVFSHANIQELMREYFKTDLWGRTHGGLDPIIHFYEDFLKEYDPLLRKKMGAYYTPLPVVSFIVRSVDRLLEKEFGLAAGLADTTKLESGLHRVQVLDPAAGTGTFISAVIRRIYERLKAAGQEGRWPAYVHHDLLPRLYGFELMMAPYTIAHLKLSMAFQKTGFWNFRRRLGIYLTNSLEESAIQEELFLGFGLAQSIAEESKQAAEIKTKRPIMVVIGNPPYSAVSSNETNYANNLVAKYKVEPGGQQKLQERKHWLNDDYVKFIALAENFIEKNSNGIVAMITNHGYIDNPTFRGMRWHLMKTFDSIHVLDLHGNAKRKEVSPDGTKDENVFNIQQGVAIILAVKTGKKKPDQLASVYHADIYGRRERKFEELNKEPKWQSVAIDEKMYFFVNKNTKGRDEYEKGFAVNQFLQKNTTGIVTMGDAFIIDESREALEKRVSDFLSEDISEETLRTKYGLGKNYAKWIVENKKTIANDSSKIVPIAYRPFNIRYTYFDNKLVWRPRINVMSHFLKTENIGLVLVRSIKTGLTYQHCFISRNIIESSLISNKTSEINYVFPLYLYTDDDSRVPNLKKEIVGEIEKVVGKTTPEDIFDYIYAVLHSPSYREKYKEFLKIDFPRVPYPRNKNQFQNLAALGKELRELHLLESPKVNQFITTYPVASSNVVEKVTYKGDKVFINPEQYFGNVPEAAWNFYIGGYQPAQKWLKDRKGRTLTNTDIEHYQKIIVALTETDRVMKEINGLEFE